MMRTRFGIFCVGIVAILALVNRPALGVFVVPTHDTDGQFTSPAEWDTSRPTVAKQTFGTNPVNHAGGAALYAEQVGGTLYLMYDYFTHPTSDPSNSFFDVFFQVPSEGTDYLVRILNGGTFSAFEKTAGAVASRVDDAFDLTDPVWHSLDTDDLALAKFKGDVEVGPSPDSSADHLMAEFQLTINSDPTHPNGIYSPECAFWSASEGDFAPVGALFAIVDPPISSAIFTLNPDGTTTVVPALGRFGDPVPQPEDVVSAPEAASWLIWLVPTVGTVLLSRRRRVA